VRRVTVRLVLLAVALLATCVIVQSLGMLVLIRWLSRVRRVLESRSTYLRVALLLRLFIGIVLLHLVQVGLWAVVFWRAKELPNVETALYFSLATYTTIGFGDVVLGPGWRVLAGIEGLTGILLVGWSTAFVFAVVNRMYEHWRQVHSAS
jgi:voltage-gated potassium channel